MHVQILGIRGIPARHGGFETFAEQLALYLRNRGCEITVYCQQPGASATYSTEWNGISLIHVPAPDTPLGTFVFDFRSTIHASRQKGIALTLGYNTAVFSVFYRIYGKVNVMNMDGIEWRREKWSFPFKLWFWANEWLGAKLANRLVADNPGILKHLSRHTNPEKIALIPYTEQLIEPSKDTLERFGLVPGGYDLVIARPEPENSVLEIVRAFSRRCRRTKLVVLGNYSGDTTPYRLKVLAEANEDVRFLGAIYEKSDVRALRLGARIYVHGHRVGGTNPSLVESLGAGNAVVANDNIFNRWVAGPDARYFSTEDDLASILDEVDANEESINSMREASLRRFIEDFNAERVLGAYFNLLRLAEFT